ncbi:V-set and immunoglobulin domain-containing protein 1 [Rhinophrynus dorsalis]
MTRKLLTACWWGDQCDLPTGKAFLMLAVAVVAGGGRAPGVMGPVTIVTPETTIVMPLKATKVYYLMSGQANTGLNYRNRLTAAISPGNATIIINNVQPGDTGIYTCEVLSPPNPSTTGKIQLTVQVAPSTPHCTIRGAMDTGHYLSLLCYSEEGMPRPTYSWNKVTDGVLSPTPPQMNQKKGILIIGNMSKFDDGHYRCTASNFLGNSTCELDLHTGGEGGIIAAAVIGALVLATIIIVAIWFLIVKKKHKKREPATSETKPINSPGGNPTYASEVHEPARENLVASAAPETIEFHDRAENVASANGEMEDPSA